MPPPAKKPTQAASSHALNFKKSDSVRLFVFAPHSDCILIRLYCRTIPGNTASDSVSSSCGSSDSRRQEMSPSTAVRPRNPRRPPRALRRLRQQQQQLCHLLVLLALSFQDQSRPPVTKLFLHPNAAAWPSRHCSACVRPSRTGDDRRSQRRLTGKKDVQRPYFCM